MRSDPRTALFPGTFDPLTNGHLDVICRGQHLFDRIVVAIGHNPAKQSVFSMDERADMIERLVRENCGDNVEVETYKGLTVDFAKTVGAVAILRGLRNVTDLNFEFQLALTNRAVADIETVFVMSGASYGFTSSSLIRQIAAGGDIERLHRLLPPLVLERLKQKKAEARASLFTKRTDGFKE